MISPWYAIAVAAIVELPTLLRSFSVYRAARQGQDDSRCSTAHAWRAAGWQILLVGLIAWALRDGLITTGSIGLRTDNLVRSFFYGWLAWIVMQMLGAILQQHRSTEYGVRDYLRTQRRIWPRGARGRFAILLTLVLNPLTEEVISRGILVLMVHQATGSIVAGVATGLSFCLITHLFQGVRSFLSHSLFFGITVCLAYSEGGLAAAIVCHLFADLQGVFNRNDHRAWVRYERARRRAPPVEAKAES